MPSQPYPGKDLTIGFHPEEATLISWAHCAIYKQRLQFLKTKAPAAPEASELGQEMRT